MGVCPIATNIAATGIVFFSPVFVLFTTTPVTRSSFGSSTSSMTLL